MKDGIRLYINLTNYCNLNCPFCCMYSNSFKKSFISFSSFKKIIDETKDKFELQLEGGEPLFHEEIFLFIEYAMTTKRCTKVIILTNGTLIQDGCLNRFISIANWYKTLFEFKVSINSYIMKLYPSHLDLCSNLHFATKYMPYVNFIFNVRLTKNESKEKALKLLKKYDIADVSNIYYLQSYGRLTNDTDYEKPVIVQNIADWKLYASDGTCFDQDLIARSEYEGKL